MQLWKIFDSSVLFFRFFRTMLLRVAVIGAGAAGLCAARHILSRPNVFASPVVFELTNNIGGTWCYDERVGAYSNGRPIHSSMYRDLRCVSACRSAFNSLPAAK